MKKLFSLLLLFCAALLNAQSTVYTIDFNNYTAGNLNGQDGWKTFREWQGNVDFQVSETAGPTTVDGSQAIYFTNAGPGVGRVATRKPSPNFDFNFKGGGLRILEFDMHGCWWGTWVCIGFDKNGNGKMTPNQGNIEPNEGGLIFGISGYDFPNSSRVVLPSGTTYNFTMDAANNGRWSRVRLSIDLDANGGQGSLSVSMREDLIGGSPYVPIEGAQDLNLFLDPGSGFNDDPEKWDAISLQVQGATGAFDNLIFTKPSPTYQFINFPAVPDRLTTDGPYLMSATASSGLAVSYEVVSGPATVTGNVIVLTGEKGFVTIRALQTGGNGFDAAAPVENTFEVVFAGDFPPSLDLRTPVNGATVAIPQGLSPMLLSAYASVEHADIISADRIHFEIGNETVVAQNHQNGHFTAWWTPPAYGTYNMTVKAFNSEDYFTAYNSTFEVVNNSANKTQRTFDQTWLLTGNGLKDTLYTLPAHVGAYDQIIGKLYITCPPGGCDPWDRVSSIKVKSHEGTWVEIIRYITPYGVPCSHEIDLTDFFPILQGKVEMKADLLTFGNGFEYTLDLEYRAGNPTYKYGNVDVLWNGGYSFGNLSNLQPAELHKVTYAPNAVASRLKLISTGHSWGDNNTGNAAEFHEDTHHIRINGSNAFAQYNWWDCNPNPQGCQPQNGTWYFNRAGWCPGTIAQWFDFNMTQYIGQGPLEMRYIFDEDYIDFCSPSNPNCVSGVTCPDCDDPSANPVLDVWANLVTFSNQPTEGVTGVNDLPLTDPQTVQILPNPTDGKFRIEFRNDLEVVQLSIRNTEGREISQMQFSGIVAGDTRDMDLGDAPSGVYFLNVHTEQGIFMKKIIRK